MPPPTSSLVPLSVAMSGENWKTVTLRWAGSSWPTVDLYRNGVRIKNVTNTGSTTDTVFERGRYDYWVCAGGSRTACSVVATAVW